MCIILTTISISGRSLQLKKCSQKIYPTGSVCVCNSTYCDTIPELQQLHQGAYQLFTSNEAGLRFESFSGKFSPFLYDESNSLITIDRFQTYQTIIGFGGAFTDSVGIVIKSLPEAAQEKLLRSYFSNEGSEYSLCRVPVGGTDFSTRFYTYADESVGSLDGFALQREDYHYKVIYMLSFTKNIESLNQ